MKIPHTIPKLVLRVYSQKKKTPEELAAQYEGRVLRSEDVTWDEGIFDVGHVAPLAKQCLDMLIKDYPFYVKLTNEWNRLGAIRHEQNREQWVLDLEEYKIRKASYEDKLHELDLMLQRFGKNTRELEDMLNADSSSSSEDESDEFKRLKNLTEPVEVPEEFPDYTPFPPVLEQLNDVDRIHFIEEVDFEKIPLELAIETIPDEYYWERVCTDRWPDADPYHHGESWKRMFMEKHVREAIETFHPAESEWEPLLELLGLCGSFAITMTLNNLIPECWGVPRKPVEQPIFTGDEPPPIESEEIKFTPEDEGFEDSEYMKDFRQKQIERKEKLARAQEKYKEEGRDDEVTEEDLLKEAEALEEAEKKPRTSSHLDLTQVIPKLTNLTKLSIVYEMAEMGENWEPRFFEFTTQDCEWLAKALADTPTIFHFELNRSRMTAEQTKLLVREGLLKMQHLKILNLNYNNMGPKGALAIARLITDTESRVRNTLHTLKIARNNIRSKGAKAIAYALTLNTHLAILDMRLNHIRNSGGKDLGHALVVNKSLQCLSLGANYLGEPACLILAKMLQHNSTLIDLDLSSNDLGATGGEVISRSLRFNKTLLKLDVRLANTPIEIEYEIESYLKKNRSHLEYFLTDRDDVVAPELEEGEGDEGEEEEEEEEEEEPEVVTKWRKSGEEGDEDYDSDQDDDMVDLSVKPSATASVTRETEAESTEEGEGESEEEEEEEEE